MTPSNNLFASIDMGTNSFKMLIIQTDKTGKFLTIDRHKDPVCLGRDFSSSISKESLIKAVTCLKRFNQVLKANKISPQQTICVATATVREANNVFDFKRSVLESIGFEVSVLSGEEEARFVYLGVLQFLPVFDKRVLVIDIGGGSTEFVIGEKGNVVLGVSLKLGHVGLTQKFGKDWNLMEMREFVKLVIKESELVEKIKAFGGFEVVVGTSGTIRAIEKAVFNGYGKECVEGNEVLLRDCKREWKFSRGELSGVVKSVCREGEEEGVKREGFFKRRSEFIVAGSVLLEEIFEAVGIEEMEVSEYALGEGVIAETLSKSFEGYDLNENARWQSAVRLATRFSGKKGIKSAARCSSIAKEIFEGLRKWSEVAGNQIDVFLDAKDLECLEASCLLHNIGLVDGKTGYHKQSYHIIMNGNHLQGYSAEEVKVRLIALLTRHHRKKFPKFDESSLQEFADELKQKFRVLCAIIRLSVVLQQSDGLNFQDMEFLHSQEGFKLIFREAGTIASFPLAGDMGKELRKELEHFKTVFQQNLLLEVLPE
ncbi:exopolyphosphatase [Salix suchowensis]|nr:exopolyphosphatase [Salix suchowensis]